MSNPLSLSLVDYPHLAKLITGQKVELEIKATVGTKTLTGMGEYITLSLEEIEIEESDVRPSVQEILLASIDASLNKSTQLIP